MSEARVDNLEQIKTFKRALWRFAEIANTALAEAESEASGTLRWLEGEQRSYWDLNVRKSQDLVSRCAEALRHKKLFKDASGRIPSAVDEEKALAKAKKQLEYALQRQENVRRYTPRVQREIMLYKGQVQKLATFVAADIPAAAGALERMVGKLEEYVNLATPTEVSSGVSLPEKSMAAPTDDRPAPAPEADVEKPAEADPPAEKKVEPS